MIKIWIIDDDKNDKKKMFVLNGGKEVEET